MNWNQLETRLASWTPRQPSAAVKQKLFRQTQPSWVHHFEAHLWRILTPGFALFLGLCMLHTRSAQTFTPIISSGGVSTVNERLVADYVADSALAHVAMNDRLLASYPDAGFTEHNIWPSSTFEWTNRSRSLTSPAPLFVTNQ